MGRTINGDMLELAGSGSDGVLKAQLYTDGLPVNQGTFLPQSGF